jgi:hypothetical protein
VGRVRSPHEDEPVKVWAAEMERRRRSRRRLSFERRWISSAAARVGEGEEEGVGARERMKGQL